MADRNILVNALADYDPWAREPVTTADILARMPQPQSWWARLTQGQMPDLEARLGPRDPSQESAPLGRYLKDKWGSAGLPYQQPGAIANALSYVPEDVMFAANFLGPKLPLPRRVTANPKSFMDAVRGRDIPAGNNLALRWNPEQQWLDIMRGGQPVGRTFVTPVNAKTGYIDNPDAFILGPKVEDAFRRQGIGSATYDALAALGEQHGMRMVPGLDLSRAAFNLWRKRDPELLTAALSREGAHAALTPDDKIWLAAQPSRVMDPI